MVTMLPFEEAADRVKSSLDIVDIVQRHVVLKRSGRNFVGLCPFHKDKNPSMNVSREKGMFKCFSCGVGGDALTFMMKRESKTYGEVIRDLAGEQGIEILFSGQDKEAAEKKRSLREKITVLNDKANQWFQQQLQNDAGAQTRQYLLGRQIDASLQTQFELGYAPQGWENLIQHLNTEVSDVKDEPDLLVTAGLAKNRQEGNGAYDAFRHRLIIPIHDDRGQVVAFGGRALSDEDKPKYLNSPETLIYHKSRVLYGLNLAKETIRDTTNAVVMEGYFDVIRAHSAGITQAVGSCGTAMTDEQLKLLTKYGARTVYLAFDSDEAGLKAALSAIAVIEPYLALNQLDVRIVVVPAGKDPDDFIRDSGGDAFTALMEKAVPFLDFKFQMALRDTTTGTAHGRVDASNKITPLLAAIRQPVLKAEFIKKYAERINVSEEALLLEVRRYEQAKGPKRNNFLNFNKKSQKKAIFDRGRSSFNRHKSKLPNHYYSKADYRLSDNLSELRQPLSPGVLAYEKLLLRFLLLNPESCRIMLELLSNKTLTNAPCQAILEAVQGLVSVNTDGMLGLANDSKETPSSMPITERLVGKLSHTFAEEEAIQQVFTDVIFTMDSLVDEFGLAGLAPTELKTRLEKVVADYTQRLARVQRLDKANKLMVSEPNEVELQYQLRDTILDPVSGELQDTAVSKSANDVYFTSEKG